MVKGQTLPSIFSQTDLRSFKLICFLHKNNRGFWSLSVVLFNLRTCPGAVSLQDTIVCLYQEIMPGMGDKHVCYFRYFIAHT